MKKYEITDIAHPDNPNLHRIRAVISYFFIWHHPGHAWA